MDGTCTRFPIQISFRQAPGPPKVRARIVPGRLSEDDAALRERIRDFNIERTEITPEAMDQIIQEVCTSVSLALLGVSVTSGSSLIVPGNGARLWAVGIAIERL